MITEITMWRFIFLISIIAGCWILFTGYRGIKDKRIKIKSVEVKGKRAQVWGMIYIFFGLVFTLFSIAVVKAQNIL